MPVSFLYLYRNDELHKVYVGIGDSPSRVWEAHNAEATELLAHPATKVFITSDPFPDRVSAERAESAAICAAAAAGVAVIFDDDRAKTLERLTNIAKVATSKHLTRAVYQTDGVLKYDDLSKAAIVTLHLGEIDDVGDGTSRPALHGGRDSEVFHQRATRWWGLGAAEQRRRRSGGDNDELPRDVERLVAVQKGTYTVLGAWTLTAEQWRRDSSSWMFVTEAPIEEWRGQQFDWCGASHSGGAMIWSKDIRALL
jgi:hypothetical protein